MLPSEISITGDISNSLQQYFIAKKYSKVVVLVDENTQKDCLPIIEKSLPTHHLIRINSGESQKILDTCTMIWSAMTDQDLDRHALMINLGGGVIGDMGGFCAATYKRGIHFINIPTTLLAQVDASIGGKLGIDFKGLKNHIGVFSSPDHVFLDTVFLGTLPTRQLRSGFAEVIKHCLIADGQFWEKLKKRDYQDQNWDMIVEHSVGIKDAVVQSDPTETGYRKVLNFGHTIGHALETFYLNSKGSDSVLHGEAIASGMICETYLSEEIMALDEMHVKEIESYITGIYNKIDITKSDVSSIIDLIRQDKKNMGGVAHFSLLKQIGECTYNVPVKEHRIQAALERYLLL